MVELVDTLASGVSGLIVRGGSSPLIRTNEHLSSFANLKSSFTPGISEIMVEPHSISS